MSPDHENRSIDVSLEERSAGFDALIEVDVYRRSPLRLRELTGMVNHIPCDHGVLIARGEPNRDVSGCVSGCRFEPDFVADAVIGVDQIDEA